MKKINTKKVLISLLSVAMIMQNAPIMPSVYANEVTTEMATESEIEIETESEIESETEIETETEAETEAEVNEEAPLKLQNAMAIIPSTATNEEVKSILCHALIVNPEEQDPSALEWEYYGEGKSNLGAKKSAWGSVEGFTFKEGNLVKTTYTVPAIQNAADGDYQVRLVGTDQTVILTKAAKLESSITCSDVDELTIGYDQNGNIDYPALYKKIWDEVVESTTPELSLEDVSITYQSLPVPAVGELGKD